MATCLASLAAQVLVGQTASAPYALDFRVHKTFVDCRLDRPQSLDGFFCEREVRSCPVSMISEPEESECQEKVQGPFSDSSTAASSAGTPPRSPEIVQRQVWSGSMPFFSFGQTAPVMVPAVPIQAMPSAGVSLPSIGSAAHSDGSCRPCAFFHAKGCSTGANCQFCTPGEKKRRQREKKAFFGALRKLQQLMGGQA